MAQVAGTGGPHFKITFNPKAKLDLSQVVDRRAEPQKRGTIMSYIRSQQKLIRRSTQPISTEQFRARERILKPYRKLKIGSMKVRGGK